MTITPSSTISRRAALAHLSIGPALCLTTLIGPSRLAHSGESAQPKEWKPYKSPDLAIHFDRNALAQHPLCTAECFRERSPRLDKVLRESCSLKIFIDGGVLGKNTLQAVMDRGWIERLHRKQPEGPGRLRFHDGTGKDTSSGNGSGTLLKIRCSDRIHEAILSNDHVIYGSDAQTEAQSVSNHTHDINLLHLAHFRTPLPDSDELPVGRVAGPHITNENVASKRVQIVGIGWELYNFVGTPIALSFRERSQGDIAPSKRCFALLVDHAWLGSAANIGGMSGSPVVIEGTREVVGTLSRAYTIDLGSRSVVALVFAGPDDLRDLLYDFCRSKQGDR